MVQQTSSVRSPPVKNVKYFHKKQSTDFSLSQYARCRFGQLVESNNKMRKITTGNQMPRQVPGCRSAVATGDSFPHKGLNISLCGKNEQARAK